MGTIGKPDKPDARAHHQIVYHAGHQQVYLIGGSTQRGEGYHYFREMQQWNGENWISMPDLPFPRSSHRVVYHEKRNSLILFGGGFERAVRAEGVIWEWKDKKWTALGGNLEIGTNEPGLCYDQKRDQIVIFGGWDTASNFRGDTWVFSNEDLARVYSTGPATRAGHMLQYDPVRETCVLFGGKGEKGFLTDTWEWDGKRWNQLEVNGPSARWFFGSATDPEYNRIVIFGGQSPQGDLSETWTWDGNQWSKLQIEGPPARSMAKLAFTGSGILLFGGRQVFEGGFEDLNDTWELRNGRWHQKQ